MSRPSRARVDSDEWIREGRASGRGGTGSVRHAEGMDASSIGMSATRVISLVSSTSRIEVEGTKLLRREFPSRPRRPAGDVVICCRIAPSHLKPTLRQCAAWSNYDLRRTDLRPFDSPTVTILRISTANRKIARSAQSAKLTHSPRFIRMSIFCNVSCQPEGLKQDRVAPSGGRWPDAVFDVPNLSTLKVTPFSSANFQLLQSRTAAGGRNDDE